MKKIILCSVLSIMALLYSCNKDVEIESGYQVNVTVDPSNVINTFISYDDDDFDMLDGDVLRISISTTVQFNLYMLICAFINSILNSCICFSYAKCFYS